MANSKISALTSATTPLAGTETLPVVQSSATKQVSVANITAGRAVSALSLSCTSTVSTTIASKTASFDAAGGSIYSSYDDGTAVWRIGAGIQAAGQFNLYRVTGAINAFTVDSTGNLNLGVGNLVPSTAAKGINFTANTPLAGMTSQLLNWYEEGTWTPTIAAASGTITSYTLTTANYTRVGRQVTANIVLTITNAGTGTGALTATLPFANGAAVSCGAGRENALTGFILQAYVNATSSTLNIFNYANGTVIATNAQVRVSITYFV